MKNKNTIQDFKRQSAALSKNEKCSVIGGRSSVPFGLNSVGMLDWGDVDIRRVPTAGGFKFNGPRRLRTKR